MEEYREQSRFAGPLAVILAAIGTYASIALLSYHTGDGSFNSFTAGSHVLHNLGGRLGAQLSDFLIQALGAAAYVIPFCLLYSAAILILASELPEWGIRELLATIVVACSLAGVLQVWADRILLLEQEVYAGGAIGKLLVSTGSGLIGRAGILVACSSIGGLASVYLFRFSFTRAFRMVSWTCKHLLHKAVNACTRRFFAKKEAEELDQVLEDPKLDGTPVLSLKMNADNGDREEFSKEPRLTARGGVEEKLGAAPDFMEECGGSLDDDEGPTPQRSAAEIKKGSINVASLLKPRAEVPTFPELGEKTRFIGGAVSTLPSVELLDPPPPRKEGAVDEATIESMAGQLVKKLADYKVDGAITGINPGPVVTMFEFEPAAGIKVSKIAGLTDDLALAMHAISVRILAPIPGKGVVGIELPNRIREMVALKEMFMSKAFNDNKLNIPIAMGKDTSGIPFVADLARMPHLLVAGSTGSGKSVFVNSVILSILFTRTPEEVRLIMVDPKMLELSAYEGIPHLLLPVVTDPKKAATALRWGVTEMGRRYQLMSQISVRNINNYNAAVERMQASGEMILDEDGNPKHKKLPFVVIIVDELADLMMVAGKDVEDAVARLAQMARAAGIHLILATQRPSVDVVTGLIKANFPSRVSFRVSSKIDSRTILDQNGAEALLGQGDMLYLAQGESKVQRIHGAFVSDEEVQRVVAEVRSTGTPDYSAEVLDFVETEVGSDDENGEEVDEAYQQALDIAIEARAVSISMIQRRLRIGYNRAARIVEQMEAEGIVSMSDGTSKPREVFLNKIRR